MGLFAVRLCAFLAFTAYASAIPLSELSLHSIDVSYVHDLRWCSFRRLNTLRDEKYAVCQGRPCKYHSAMSGYEKQESIRSIL